MSQPVLTAADLWKGSLPVHGVITAGPLTGWRYAFLQFIRIDNTLAMDLRCTQPNWPFPKTVRFQFAKHEIAVRAVPGERAKRLDVNVLIERCLQVGIAKCPYETI